MRTRSPSLTPAPAERAFDTHPAQPLLHVRHRFGIGEIGERDRAFGGPAVDAPRVLAFAHDVEALLLGTQHDVRLGVRLRSPRASSTSCGDAAEQLVEPVARHRGDLRAVEVAAVATSALVPTTTRGRSSRSGW